MEDTRKEIREEQEETPDKKVYVERILSLSAEDQAFMDGYLFAKVTTTKPA